MKFRNRIVSLVLTFFVFVGFAALKASAAEYRQLKQGLE